MNERDAYNFLEHCWKSRLLRVGAGDGTLARNIGLHKVFQFLVAKILALSIEGPGSQHGYETYFACDCGSRSPYCVRTFGSGASAPDDLWFHSIGLFYQACFSVAASLVMWLLVKFAWPSELEREVEGRGPEEDSAH